jgi:hypothetical protein
MKMPAFDIKKVIEFKHEALWGADQDSDKNSSVGNLMFGGGGITPANNKEGEANEFT